jgi:hypothetical protein
MGNVQARQQSGQGALKVLNRFSQERIMALWNQVVLDAIPA